jgi:hypothetical protein
MSRYPTLFKSWIWALSFAFACNLVHANEVTLPPQLTLRIPVDGKVLYSGVVNNDSAGLGTGAFLYPAFGLVGFLAAVATHGIINSSAKSIQKSKLQETADQVLTPYREALDTFTYGQLFERTKNALQLPMELRVTAIDKAPVTEWRLDSEPGFLLTPDQSALILEVPIAIYAPNASTTDQPVYKNVIKVVSDAVTSDDLTAQWSANNSELVKATSAKLMADSLNIALLDWQQTSTATATPQQTLRYMIGHTEKIERGQIISLSCQRLLLRNLRGALIAATPSSKLVADLNCPVTKELSTEVESEQAVLQTSAAPKAP